MLKNGKFDDLQSGQVSTKSYFRADADLPSTEERIKLSEGSWCGKFMSSGLQLEKGLRDSKRTCLAVNVPKKTWKLFGTNNLKAFQR